MLKPKNKIVKMIKRTTVVLLVVALGAFIYQKILNRNVGDTIDEFNGIAVHYNGLDYSKSYGKHYSTEGYYYGKKWQCVEFVKRYYYDYLHHKMPDGSGHAKSFFDKELKHGEVNKRRNLIQYDNGGNVKPEVNDLLVFDGGYGHVCIISKVNSAYIEVVQQNISFQSRTTYQLTNTGSNYLIGTSKKPLGWLRKP